MGPITVGIISALILLLVILVVSIIVLLGEEKEMPRRYRKSTAKRDLNKIKEQII